MSHIVQFEMSKLGANKNKPSSKDLMMLAELFVCEPKQCHACQPRKAQMSGAKIQTRMTDRHRALREAQMAQRMTKKQVPDGVRSMSESALVGAPSVESPTSLMSMSRVAPSVTESFSPSEESPLVSRRPAPPSVQRRPWALPACTPPYAPARAPRPTARVPSSSPHCPKFIAAMDALDKGGNTMGTLSREVVLFGVFFLTSGH